MEFRCPDPNATVRAANVRATLDAFKLVPSMGNRLVEKHRLPPDDLRPNNLVPVQRWLDALAEIQSVIGNEVVRGMGAAIIENADFPPQFNSVESVLLALDDIYHLNHRRSRTLRYPQAGTRLRRGALRDPLPSAVR